MKLDINKSYIIYTNSDYIVNKQVRILGYINYDRASQYQSFIENVAINEKFIDNSSTDTVEYLKSQIYYDCCVLEYENGEYKLTDEHLILWDDIIDSERSERLFEDHQYKIAFKFKNVGVSDNLTKDKVIATIQNAIDEVYNANGTKVDLTITEITDDDDNVENQLTKAKAALESATETLAAFNSLQDSAKTINSEFSDNNIVSKITSIGDSITEIKSTTDVILANLK